MKEITYTRKTVINSLTGIISYAAILLSTMGSRIVFSRFLSKELLGLNSLYASVLDLLLISELGISTAMVVFLYEPVKNKAQKQVLLIMRLYARLYFIFAVTLLFLGLAVMFFVLPHIVQTNAIEQKAVQIYFLLFLLGTLGSYAFAHVKSLFFASQQNRVIAIGNAINRCAVAVLQCLVVARYKNYYAFLVIRLLGNVVECVCYRYIVLRQFPYLRMRPTEKLETEVKKQISQTIKPIFITQLADKVLAQSDTILINKFVSIVTLGVFSNYSLIFSACGGLFRPVGSALTTSYGGLSVNGSAETKYMAYKNSYPFCHLVVTLLCSSFIVFIQDFIYIAFGQSFLLSDVTCIILSAYLYLDLVKSIYYSYQNALGMQKLDQKQMVLQVPFNIITSVLLALILGLNGIILGTVLTLLVFPIRYKGFILYKKIFEVNPIRYYGRLFFDFLQIFISMAVLFFLSKMFAATSISYFALKVVVFGVLIVILNVSMSCLSSSNRNVFFSFIRNRILHK